jgi:2-polyprenyl-3-methyl-5-hydroxy-6-metoxy-1,4-benzoquinol methylase
MDALSPKKGAAASIEASNNNAGGNARIKDAPVTAAVWDEQYRSGGWEYLESEDELAHYLAICVLYQHHLRGRTVLDIGCGTGILFRHLVERTGMQPSLYIGIDVSGQALQLAANRYPEVRFERCDYSDDLIRQRFGCLIFNETLYCFDDPVSILKKGLLNNLEDGGLVIVSMYDDHLESLWEAMAACCATVEERTVQNSKQVRWKIRALKPLMTNDARSRPSDFERPDRNAPHCNDLPRWLWSRPCIPGSESKPVFR